MGLNVVHKVGLGVGRKVDVNSGLKPGPSMNLIVCPLIESGRWMHSNE